MEATFFTTVLCMIFQPALSVRVYNYAGTSRPILEKAKAESHRIFSLTGVETEWVDCPLPGQAPEDFPGCIKPAGSGDVVLRIIPPGMGTFQGTTHSFGYVLPFVDRRPAVLAWIVYHRIHECVRQHDGLSEHRLLAYVMAHEIGHLLFGHERHSPGGIMQAGWTGKQLARIEAGLLEFTSEEGMLLRAGVKARMATSTGATSPGRPLPQ